MSNDQLVDAMFRVLGIIFKSRDIAPLYFLPGFLIVTVGIWIYVQSRAWPWMRACRRRINSVHDALGRDRDPITQRSSFAERFGTVSTVLGDPSDSEGLARAWSEYHETIVDETQVPIRNTARPLAFFSRATPSFQLLAFFSNIFVGLGLVLTFLGIVVALDSTAKGINSPNVEATQGALAALLSVASAKFFASIAALTSSLILRIAEYHGQSKAKRLTQRLCDLLERGLLYVSPQFLAVQQLEELQRQSGQLERFNADLAITIGEQVGARFQAAVVPITTSLSALNSSMNNMSQNLREGLGQGAADAVNAAASGELRALGQTLEGLRVVIDGMRENVSASGGEAARQIRTAGADFAEASKRIKEAFEQLTGRVDFLGQSMTEQGEEAQRRHSSLLDGAINAFASTQVEANESISAAIRRLGEAGRDSADRIKDQLSTAIGSATEESRAHLVSSLSETSAGFADAGRAMIDAVRQSAQRIDELANSIARSERGAAATAEAFLSTTDSARIVSTTVADTARRFEVAAAPITGAIRSIQQAVDQIERTVGEFSQARAGAIDEVRTLSSGLRETNTAAQNAWRDYQTRFANVDEDLQRTLQLLTKTLSDSMEEFRKFAHDVDLQMSKAVNRFSDSLGSIEEHSEVLADFVEAVRNSNRLAAE